MTTITATAEHIADGIPGDARACPVALAVIDTFPDAEDVSVGDYYISMYHAGQSRLLRRPEEIRALIGAIDAKLPVEPFTFELDYPEATS